MQGHDTTAALIAWSLFLIGHHTDVQRKLHQELDAVFGKENDPSDTHSEWSYN